MSPADTGLQLRLDVDEAVVILRATNTGHDSVALWEQDNSWGWPMPRLHVWPTSAPDTRLTIHTAGRVWTANLPTFERLRPGQSMNFVLRSQDLDLAVLGPWPGITEQPLLLQGELCCDPSPDAAEYGVWCGVLRSPIRQFDPPHRWLPTPSEL
jgi:hypothetical protein